jgi:hypothetical protein
MHPPPIVSEVIERLDLHLYSPSVPSWNVTIRTLPFIIQCRTTYKHQKCLCQLTLSLLMSYTYIYIYSIYMELLEKP